MHLVAILSALCALKSALASTFSNRAGSPEVIERPNERRGVAYNRPELVKAFDHTGTRVKWIYNWDSISPHTKTWFEFVPMLYSDRTEHTGTWFNNIRAAAKVVEANPTHLLGFHEPDVCQPGAGGSCIDVVTAVRAWREWIEPTAEYKKAMYFGSPAVTNSDRSDEGLNWLREFMRQCEGCKVDYMCIHWYGDATNTQSLKDHIDHARAISDGRPIWITEFMARGTDDEVKRFLDEVLPWLDKSNDVQRYAYFMAQPGMLINLNGQGLSEMGKHYASSSHQESD